MSQPWPRKAWHHTVAFGFRLLYNELAWLYDPVSWLVSLGRWRAWQRTALDRLPPGGRVLEVGSGPGHLLADLSRAGYHATGLDLSRTMLRQARRRLKRLNMDGTLCQGQANALPFGPGTFDAIVATFPTPYVYQVGWLKQAHRALRAGGRLIVVEMATLCQRDLASQSLEWLYSITGQRGPAPDLAALLEYTGFSARREVAEVEGTSVALIVADLDQVGTGRLATTRRSE
jgi:ubiquinone/menaquinone biosynthesis C-methylase UbiE